MLQQALRNGHEVKALVRNPAHAALQSNLSETDRQQLHLVTGDARDAKAVAEALDGQDVAIVSLGSTPWADDKQRKICSEGQAVINEAVAASPTVKRVIVVSSLGVNESYKDLSCFTKIFVDWVIWKAIEDKNVQEMLVKEKFAQGDKDWVIVRPGGLNNNPKTEKVKAEEEGIGGGMISRQDVAWYILMHCLQGPENSRKAKVLINA